MIFCVIVKQLPLIAFPSAGNIRKIRIPTFLFPIRRLAIETGN